MKVTIFTTQEVEADSLTLYAYIPTQGDYGQGIEFNGCLYENLDAMLKDYPQLSGEINRVPSFLLKINLGSGKVMNWPQGATLDLHGWKIGKNGFYQINNENDEHDNCVVAYLGGVPKCLVITNKSKVSGERDPQRLIPGQELAFNIDENGYIPGWEFAPEFIEGFYLQIFAPNCI